jgi:hypothetical protein
VRIRTKRFRERDIDFRENYRCSMEAVYTAHRWTFEGARENSTRLVCEDGSPDALKWCYDQYNRHATGHAGGGANFLSKSVRIQRHALKLLERPITIRADDQRLRGRGVDALRQFLSLLPGE